MEGDLLNVSQPLVFKVIIFMYRISIKKKNRTWVISFMSGLYPI